MFMLYYLGFSLVLLDLNTNFSDDTTGSNKWDAPVIFYHYFHIGRITGTSQNNLTPACQSPIMTFKIPVYTVLVDTIATIQGAAVC